MTAWTLEEKYRLNIPFTDEEITSLLDAQQHFEELKEKLNSEHIKCAISILDSSEGFLSQELEFINILAKKLRGENKIALLSILENMENRLNELQRDSEEVSQNLRSFKTYLVK